MTLVLLGVFGCVPAFDNNFSVSLRDAGIPAVPWITPLLDAEVSGWRQTGFRVGESLRSIAPIGLFGRGSNIVPLVPKSRF